MTGIVATIINNLKVEINNLHIRVEHKIKGRTVAFGVFLPSVKVTTIDNKGIEVFVSKAKTLRKKLSIQGLSIYLDSDGKPMSLGPDFNASMRASMTAN